MDYANFSANVLNKTNFLGRQEHADSEAVALKTKDGKQQLYARDANAKAFTVASVSSLFGSSHAESAARVRLGKFNDGLSSHKTMVSDHLKSHGVSETNIQRVLGQYSSAAMLTVGEARIIDSHVQAAIAMKQLEGISDTNSSAYIMARQHISALITSDPAIVKTIGVEKLKAEYEKQFSTILTNLETATSQIDDPLTNQAERKAANLALASLEAEMRELANENPHLKDSIRSEMAGLDKTSYSKFSHWMGSSSSYTQASLKLYCAKAHVTENIGAAEVIIKLDEMMRKEFGSLIADVAVATGLLNKLKNDYLTEAAKYSFNISGTERSAFIGKIDKFANFLTETAALAGDGAPNSALLSAASRRTRDFLSSTGEVDINLERMLDAEEGAAGTGQSTTEQATSGIGAGFTRSFASLDDYFKPQFTVFVADIVPRMADPAQQLPFKVWI